MGRQYSHLSSEERILIEKLHCEQHPGIRRILNLGKHNAGRMAELLIDHGRAVAAGLETGEILADQTLDATREYQYRKPANDVNDAPRQM